MKDPIFLANLTTWGYKQVLILMQFQLSSLNCYSPQHHELHTTNFFFLYPQKNLCANYCPKQAFLIPSKRNV